ncbi:MAG: hypothetical protein RMI91_05560 [Gemmatales bacterium]|nr:hypothetical protein [Gemmatales bacterium]MDW7994101.1 hypothetical protein [Gemmatales bacterium]
MPKNRHLFVVISTGQNIANLPPLLEIGRKGDLALWLETPEAAKHQWTKPALGILHQFDIESECVVLPPRLDARAWKSVLTPIMERCQREKLKPVLVLNGGHKLMSVVIYEIWRGLEPILLYGYDRPAGYCQFPSGWDRAVEPTAYKAHALDLPHILLASGYMIHSSTRFGRIYSVMHPNEVKPVPETRYGLDTTYTLQVTQQRQQQQLGKQRWVSVTSLIGQDLLESLSRSASDAWQRWCRTASAFLLTKRTDFPEQMYENLYHATVNLLASSPLIGQLDYANYRELATGLIPPSELHAWRERLRKLILDGKPTTPGEQSLSTEMAQQLFFHACALVRVYVEQNAGPSESQNPSNGLITLGDEFEVAVARRILRQLNQPQYREIVQSVWLGVRVSPQDNPDNVAAEFDVLLVLKNAILLHIECKTGVWDRKDLDARIANLKRIGSLGARLAVCAPMFTTSVPGLEPNLQRMHDNRQRLSKHQEIHYLPFTLPDQPRYYTALNEYGEPTQYEIGTFEEALSQFLHQYLVSRN